MSKTPLKKIIKSKIRTNKELTPQEKMREKIKISLSKNFLQPLIVFLIK